MNEDLRKWFYVYALLNPIDNSIFYIGKGSGNRAYDHLKPSGWGNNLHKKYKIELIRKNGKEPVVLFLHENLEENVAYELEMQEIKKCKENGIQLTNLTEGGDCGPKRYGKRSEQEKHIIAAKTKEAMWKPEIRNRHIQSVRTEENRKRRSDDQIKKLRCNREWYQKFTKSNCNPDYRNRKIIRDDGLIFNSVEDVAVYYNTKINVIVRHLLGHRKTYKKHTFNYMD